MTAPAPSSGGILAWRSNPWVRRAAAGLAIGLLLAAIAVVWGQRESLESAIAAIRTPDPGLVAIVLASVVLNLVLTALMIGQLLSRYGRVPPLQMQALIASAALFNYLPLRAGLVGRAAWHKTVNGIAIRDTAKTVVQAIVITSIAGTLLAGATLLAFTASIAWWGPVVAVALAMAAGCSSRRWGVWCRAGLLRYLDLLVWAGRYVVVFRLIGLDLDPLAAVAMACTSAVASLVPLSSNGLGLREWLIGLLAPMLTAHAMEQGITADLVNRAAEIVVIVVAGLVATAWLATMRPARSGAAT